MAGANKPEPIVVTGNDGNEYVVGTWNHGTVADGVVLTEETIKPICDAIQGGSNGLSAEIERAKKAEQEISAVVDDHYNEYTTFVNGEYTPFKESVLASADALSSKLAQEIQDRIDDVNAEETRAIGQETLLQKQIDVIKGATDVINVFATKRDFDTWSATRPTYVTDKDFIKVLVDETVSGGAQSYYQSTVVGTTTSWAFSTAMPAYYSQADFNEWSAARFTETSAKYALLAADSQKLGGTVANNIILSANAGSAASAWLNDNAIKYISDVLSSNMKYIDGTLVTATDGSARNLTISLSGWQTIGDGTYITGSSANKLITLKPADSFIGSAKSGKSAYDWITTKSATLSAGEYIKFTSAAQNTMGITVTGIYPHHGGNCITVDAVAGQSYSSINLSSDIFVENLKSSSSYQAQTLGPVTSYLTANYQGIYLARNSTYAGMNTTASIGIAGVDFTANNNAYSISWLDLYNGLAGNYVHASAGQTIKVATATTALTPSDMEDGYIYIV